MLAVPLLLTGCGGGQSATDGGSRRGDAAAGAALFQNHCAQCHGDLAQGTTTGPPFLSDIYVPSHHSDESFQRAVAVGVQPHHWDFGPMPAIPGLSRADVADIIAHVRQLQAEAGVIE